MSFASEMKNELTRIEVDETNAKAELSALIRMNGALSLSNQQFVINVQTENATTARRIYSLIKKNSLNNPKGFCSTMEKKYLPHYLLFLVFI